MKIKVNDTVIVISGKDKGKKGKVLKTLVNDDPNENKVVVEGVNMRTKHIKKTNQRAGERIKYEAPIHISNVMLISPSDKKPTRIGYIKEKGEKKYRICKRTKQRIE